MTDRIRELRQQSLDAIPSISAERALLITRFYQDPEIQLLPIPVQRAKAFEYILRHKTICINPGELIVGERGPAPKATPTYPEICLHSLDDLDVLDTRPKVAYKVSDEVKEAYRDTIIPYWKGKSNRERIMGLMAPEWLEAYHAGVFTEFQEQRAPGHTVCGGKIYRKGMLDLINDIHEAQQSLDFQKNPEAQARQDELTAMEIAANALIMYANRHADALEQLASAPNFEYRQSNIDNRISEIHQLISICRRVPAHAPQTFHEALQYYWFVHVGVITEVNPWDSFNPGRLDQHLYPFYRKEMDEGTLTKEQAIELLQSFWIKFNNQPAPPKVGITALESNTYTDFALINVGGLRTDGSDGSNELSYLILDVIREMRILQPSSMVQLSHKNPDALVQKALGITKTGFGQPSYFNTDAIIRELVNQGKSPEDARNGGASGCVEAGAFGTEAYFLTGYFNLTKILEITLHNGIDPASGKLIGIKTGEPDSFQTFDSLFEAY
ncbi:MAG: formate C-acetyltransferase/glycerol dehydratase family glycyl radical enzyme, partial [Bacteroidetes bacterium]|nr:formate C-acetyltransferase/glycerol dehydratase family glycyl radical enzyme [Bacteroidota bacterium]